MGEILLLESIRETDIIGDVHGCYTELSSLLQKLGYQINNHGMIESAPEGRKLIFVGDLCDRGPDTVKVLRLVIDAMTKNLAAAVRGNHDDKLQRKLAGRAVKVNVDLQYTLDSIDSQPDNFSEMVKKFLDQLPYQIIIDKDNAVIVHGGMKEELQGIESNKAKAFALYGDTTGVCDEAGYPIRRDWASSYNGKRAVIYGHTQVEKVEWINNTINIDTGCYRTGILTAVRWPERHIISSTE